MIDKSKELKTSIKLINDKLHYSGVVEGNKPISIDYIPPLGDNLGYTSLELLLLSLSSCIGSTVLIFLRGMKKKITACEVNSKGIRKEEHPTGFKKIFVEINITSSDVTENDIEGILKMSEEKYCPVWSMIKSNVEIEIKNNICR